ncbi:hypothetical protein DNU06_17200 [Putridiphycobacter roseus]|uniref:Uncharacterized protein n=1 Tax=Putridiphycobacter roseus TaxID=2219161 RepID=A0A2W1NJ13_9FLAO|nr:hypothetical protein [Putridiphycobacter roseus]PZE15612.1 hypothetical protein DNU06_17200 [Putridiphycobacter roseus]
MIRREFKYLMLLVVFSLFTSFVWGQKTAKNLLTESIKKEYPIIFSKDCSDKCLETLKRKFEYAQVYLIDELKSLILVDSSKFYENKKKELIELEKKKNDISNKNPEYKMQLEHAFLLLSIANPSKSDSLFIKLISSFMNEKINFSSSEEIESVLIYKSWLYELLNDRFQTETNAFSNNYAALFINEIILNYDQPFMSIKSEEQLIEKLANYASLASKNISKYSFEELMTNTYQHRITVIEKVLNLKHSYELFDFIEKLYLSGLKIDPNNTALKYNLGIFYYNEVTFLSNEVNEELNENELKIKEERITQFSGKAKQLLSPE